ncbi:MAG: selenoprotein [Hyphomicrobiales bacterium]|nr:selenoprotein [Hyphomicrobiales bacterium]
MPFSASYAPSRQHETLGPDFYDPVQAADFPERILRFRNQAWSERVGLGALTHDEWLAHFGGFSPLPGSFSAPLALRYHGHQFRSYNPELGDGRGFLFAQLRDDSGRLLDLGTKGSGQTPWSRSGDGRLTLKGGVREALATELLESLGVETSKTFSLVETGEALYRNDEPSPTRSGVLVRLSHSHVRIGTFQRLMYLSERDNLAKLLDYSIQTYMPDVWRDDIGERATAFVREVSGRVARMGAQWTAAGFVHGVLNTDNINITGESFDYGPWRFLPVLDLGFTAAYFDATGLYNYGRQPQALLWNLMRLAECLTPFAPASALEEAVSAFEPAFEAEFRAAVHRRMGVREPAERREPGLAQALWTFLAESRIPFERTFFDWRGGMASEARAMESPFSGFYTSEAFAPVRAELAGLEPIDAARLDQADPAGAGPCTLLIDEVEAIWAPIAERDDWSAFDAKIAAIRKMRAGA